MGKELTNIYTDQKEFNSIDLFKLLMAIVVVAFHTNAFVQCTNPIVIKVFMTIAEWVVPFFFIASGFFLFHAMKKTYIDEIERIDRYMIKIIKMYCAWTLISLPLSLYGYYISGNGILSCILSYIKYFLFVGKLYNSYHLGYLLSLIYALLAIRVMVKKKFKPITIMCVSIVVYLFSELMSILSGTPDMYGAAVGKFVSLYQYVFNKGGIFTGIIYVSAGMMIANLQPHINKYVGLVAIVAWNVLKLILEAYGYSIVTHLLMPVEMSLLFLTLLDIKLPNHIIWKKCRKASTVIYLSHLIFFSIYTFLIIKNPNKLGFDSFVVTLTMSMMNAVLLITAQEKGYLKLLGHII